MVEFAREIKFYGSILYMLLWLFLVIVPTVVGIRAMYIGYKNRRYLFILLGGLSTVLAIAVAAVLLYAYFNPMYPA